MRRKLLHLAAVASLVLCVPITALWALGSRREPGVRGAYLSGTNFYAQLTTHNHILKFNVGAGRHWPQLKAAHFPTLASGPGIVRRGEYGAKLGDLPPLPANMAFSGVSLNEAMWLNATPAIRVRVITIAVDHWLILLVLAALAVAFRKMGAPRSKAGVCFKCGYDLRGTPERCPECGMVPTAAAP